jgi:hypothetical protein
VIRQLCAIAVLIGFWGLVSTAHAQGPTNTLRFYSDPAGTSCDLVYNEIGFVAVHMMLTGSAPSTGLAFSAVKPECWTGSVWTMDVIDEGFLALGNTQNPVGGISIGAIGGCKELPVYIGYIRYFAFDASAKCCAYAPGPTQAQGIVWVDCDFVMWPMEVAGIVVNPDEACRCQQPVPVAETTWGRVKSLYR